MSGPDTANSGPSGETHQAARLGGGGGWWAVAVVDLGAAGVGHGGGAVGVEGDGPAPGVDHDEVVEAAEQDQFGEFGAAAFAARGGGVDVAAGRWLVAAGGGPLPVPQDDGPAQVRRDG